MKKPINLTLTFLFLTLLVHAQITITAEHTPIIGDKFIIAQDTAVSALDPGSAGANQIWDFSQLVALKADTIEVLDPTLIAGGEAYPEADGAIKTDTLFSFFQLSASALLNLGVLGDFLQTGIPLAVKYNTPFKLLELPTTIGTNFISTSSADAQIFYPLLGDSVRLSRKEELFVQTDAYGSLVLPSGTYQVLRQARMSITRDTALAKFGGTWAPIRATNDTIYSFEWLAREAKGAILSTRTDKFGKIISLTFTTNVEPALIVPNADFTATARGNLKIKFQDRSANTPTTWLWDFGDGNTSTEQNPEHTYSEGGEYTACLIAINSEGQDTTCRNIIVLAPPLADFSADKTSSGTFQFTDLSDNQPTGWNWDFGDGKTSNGQNPTHTYNAPGDYTTCLIASNPGGVDTVCQTLQVLFKPKAGFNYAQTEAGTFDFTDASTFEPTSWQWDFADGSASEEQNPSHTFAAAGNYNVCLTVTNAEGTDRACKNIDLAFAPAAGFQIEKLGNGKYVFRDQSTNEPTSWQWNFGDNKTANNQNTQHTYLSPGEYTVCLIIANSAGSDTTCQSLNVELIPQVNFQINVSGENTYSFKDQTRFNPLSWQWDFGDGQTSNQANPQHTYTEPGNYTVCLIAANGEGADTLCKSLQVIFKPAAAFTYEDQGNNKFKFTDQSANNPVTWLWDFGNNRTSNNQNPAHTFAQNGTYNVCLTASNSAGADTFCQTIMVGTTPTKDLAREFGLKVFPNPTVDQFSITLDHYQGPALQLQISNTFGQIVYRSILNNRQVVQTTDWPAGHYVYRLQNQQGETLIRGQVVVF